MEYQYKQQLINEFKSSTKNKDFKPTYDEEYGNKCAGKMTFIHYLFYAALINKDMSKVTHSVTSESFINIVKYELYPFVHENIGTINKGSQYILKQLQLIMPSLTKEAAIEIMTKYNNKYKFL